MASDTTPPDDGPPPDPFEAELVAYLDGELDPAAARKVEARLARDPAARARAAELKRSFDLLDYLPKPEPSPTFTTRTLDKLPAVKSGPSPSVAAAVAATRPAAKSGPAPVVGVSTSMAVPLEPGAGRERPLLWVAAACVAACLFAALGYLAATAVRPHLFSAPRDKEHVEEARAEADARVVEHLPLYAVADDLGFVSELAGPDLFGDDPAVSYDASLRVPPADDRPTAPERDALAKAFRALPAARQAEIVRLDRDLFAREPKERDRLFRALEAYAVWLDALPDVERRGVLTAATPSLRLGVVRSLREQRWLNALPQAVRGKPEQVQLWRDDEATRRDRAAFARRHAEAFATNKSPWPFDTPAARLEVQEFAREVLKADEPNPKRSRLSPDDLFEYRHRLSAAQRDGTWAWYGLVVYELAQQHPYLPEPADPRLMYTSENDLPDGVSRLVKKAAGGKFRGVVGKWPEFPLQLHTDMPAVKAALAPPLGPTHYTEFKKPLPDFTRNELLPKLTAEERKEVESRGGKWPDYSRRFVELAKKYDLAVPGVTLPGSPKRWDAIYGPPRPVTRP